MKNQRAFLRATKGAFWETVGSFLASIGIYNFALHGAFPMTGFVGIAVVLNRFFGLPVGAAQLLLNVPVALLCYRLLGRGFFLRSIRCMLVSSLMTDYLAPLLPVYQGDRMLAAICTGIFCGMGYALMYMNNSSNGGADFVTMSLKALNPHIQLGKIMFLCDLVVILGGGFLFRDVDGIIYGLLVSFLQAFVVDKMMYGANAGKLMLVVTNQGEHIAQVIEDCCHRGSTLLKAMGGYRKDDKQVVMCACSDKQMYGVQKAVEEADPQSFVVVLESHEVHGEGFHFLQLGDEKKKKQLVQ